MLLAQAEGFWKWPNVVDVVSLGLALASIWYASVLARRDIKKRLDEAAERASRAARDEVRRVVRAIFQTGVSDIVRSLELARHSCRGRQWVRALDLCLLAVGQLARVRAQAATEPSIAADLATISARVDAIVEALRSQPKVGTGSLPGDETRGLDQSIAILHGVEGRMTGVQTEAADG